MVYDAGYAIFDQRGAKVNNDYFAFDNQIGTETNIKLYAFTLFASRRVFECNLCVFA
jgi:hypothetical protein